MAEACTSDAFEGVSNGARDVLKGVRRGGGGVFVWVVEDTI